MIKEDYVSFETAKLLKEKGFNEYCWKLYELGDCNIPVLLNGFELSDKSGFWNNKYLELYKKEHCYINDICSAPTLQMAMKWLREDKKILISIFCHIDKGYWFCIQHFIESPYKFATSESIHRKEEILGRIQYYDTYEQACEAAILYCLKELIKE